MKGLKFYCSLPDPLSWNGVGLCDPPNQDQDQKRSSFSFWSVVMCCVCGGGGSFAIKSFLVFPHFYLQSSTKVYYTIKVFAAGPNGSISSPYNVKLIHFCPLFALFECVHCTL